MRKFYILLLFVFFTKNIFSQMTVTGGLTAKQLAEHLAGPNIKVFNATLSGGQVQAGSFTFSGNNFEIGSGIILTSGRISNVIGPNNNSATSYVNNGIGSSLLDDLSGKTTFDAVTLQFDFEVQSSGISFNYIFSSEEYNEWVGSPFNDAFGFFISGPGINGEENLAVVPTTNDPITINNINNDQYWQFYRDNSSGVTNMQFDGFTTMLTAKKEGLIPCNVYTLKLIVADASDYFYDTGVFLKEKSLVQEVVSGVTNTVNADGVALEGCYDASFTFNLDGPQPTNTTIKYTIGGTAINGVDYKKIDQSIIIPAGQTSATIIIDAYADGIPESQEVIELSYQPKPCEPMQTILLYIDDNEPIDFTLGKTDLVCAGSNTGQITASINGGFGPYNITVNDTATYTTLPITNLAAGTYQVKVDDKYGCGGEAQVVGAEFDAGTTFLPDGNGNVYTTSLNINGFSPGSTLVTANQLQSICLKLEHSFMGDVELKLIAPDNKEIILKERPGGNNVNFGEPVASGPVDTNSSDLTPGKGYEYCFNNDPVFLTMVEEAKENHTYDYDDNSGNAHSNEKYLPTGAYQPYQSFEGLIGAPLNGNWTIWVKDHKPNDNGYIFKWNISFISDNAGDIVVINEPDPMVITGVETKAACGSADGEIDINVNAEFLPLTYAWSNGQTTEDVGGLSAGSYSVTITDQNNCSASKTFLISNVGPFIVSGIVTNVTCASGNNGSINTTPEGGTGNYTYAWSNGTTVEDLIGLAPGNYIITVTDNTTSCIALETFSVTQPEKLNATAATVNEKCGDREGLITLAVFGGSENYIYQWSNEATSPNLKNLQAGTYNVTVTDANNCELEKSYTIINEVGDCIPDCDLTVSIVTLVDETCGQSNGFLDIGIATTNGPYSFIWSNGALTEDIASLTSGSYAINVKDKAGCEVTKNFEVLNETGTLALGVPLITNEHCGSTNGAINITVFGGTPGYSFLWSNGELTEDVSNLKSGMYSVTVTDQNNCSLTYSYEIESTSNIVQTFGYVVDDTCGGNKGSIDVNIAGGINPYSYLWTNGATTQDLKGISSGSYQCTISDNFGCTLATPIYVVKNLSGSLKIDFIDVDNERCNSGTGAIELYVNGGNTPHSFEWSTGTTGTKVINNLIDGIYSCIVSDAGGCSLNTGPITIIDEPGSLQIDNIFIQHEECSNGLGSIDLEISGETGITNFEWSNGASTEDITGLSAGIYSIEIEDEANCTLQASIQVNNNSGTLVVSDVVTTPDLCGTGAGSIDLTVIGGNTPYTFAWSNGSNDEDLANVIAGNYNCLVTDSNGCQVNANAVVPGSILVIQNITINNETCGLSNGELGVTVTGGKSPYVYLWSNGGATQNISGLVAGDYTCIINDNNGCSISTPVISLPGNSGDLMVASTLSSSQCSTKTINLTVSGGTAPYTFAWSDGKTIEDIEVNIGGTYTCKVTDADGLCRTTTIFIDPSSISPLELWLWSIDCAGSISAWPSGGSQPYTFLWSNGATTKDITNVAPGTYTCTVTDVNGCSSTQSATLGSGATSAITYTVTHDYCGTGTGAIDLNNAGSGFDYLEWYKIELDWSSWEYLSSDEDIEGLQSGYYYVWGYSGGYSCVFELTIEVKTAPAIQIQNLMIADETCANGNGTISFTLAGGTAPYTFAWSNGSTSNNITDLVAGLYVVEVTDSHNCTLESQVTVNHIPSFTISSTSIINELCSGENGGIDLTLAGGSGNFSYAWSNSATTQDILNIGAGVYNCKITDLTHNCEVNISEEILDVPTTLDIQLDNLADDICSKGQGQIDVTVNGGDNNFTYDWSNGESTQDIFNLTHGNYVLTVTDGTSCSVQEVFTVANTSNGISLQANPTHEPCNSKGSIDLEVTGGSGDYSFQWSNGEVTEDLDNLMAGTYTVLVNDNADNCAVTTTVDILSLQSLLIVDGVVTEETCDYNNGIIDLTVGGGSGSYSYSWSNGATTQNIVNLSEGVYACLVTDMNSGCSRTIEVLVPDYDNTITISLNELKNDYCDEGKGLVNLNVAGGDEIFTYSWSSGEDTKNISDLNYGTYTITVMDGHNCVKEQTFEILKNKVELAALVTDDLCNQVTGEVDISVSNGSGNLSYEWSNGITSQDIIGVGVGIYTCEVTDLTYTCKVSIVAEVKNMPSSLAIELDNLSDDLCNKSKGQIEVTVTGGDNNYTYEWSNGEVTQDIADLMEGDYTLTVTDGTNCSIQRSFEISNSTNGMNLLATPSPEQCNEMGSIDLVVTGGSGNYTFQWSNEEVTEDLINISAGTYAVKVVDNILDCEATYTATVQMESGFITSNASIADAICDLNNGAINLAVSGGSGNYSFSWSNQATSEDVANLLPGIYTCVITDLSNECAKEVKAEVKNVDKSIDILLDSIVHDSCNGSTGEIKISVKNGTAPYTYEWSNNHQQEDVTNLKEGLYTVTVTDVDKCSSQQTYEVTNISTVVITGADIINSSCTTCNNGEIKLMVSGTEPLTYNWSNGKSTQNVEGLAPGLYTVTVQHLEGSGVCADSKSFTVGVDNPNTNVISIFPNPTSGIIEVVNVTNEGVTEIEVSDVLGKRVLSHLIQPTIKNFFVDVSFLSEGTYTLKLLSGTQWITFRLIKI